MTLALATLGGGFKIRLISLKRTSLVIVLTIISYDLSLIREDNIIYFNP